MLSRPALVNNIVSPEKRVSVWSLSTLGILDEFSYLILEDHFSGTIVYLNKLEVKLSTSQQMIVDVVISLGC